MEPNIDVRNAYSVILAIFQNKICNKLPLSESEKEIVRTAKSWPTVSDNLKHLLNCFFDSDLTHESHNPPNSDSGIPPNI